MRPIIVHPEGVPDNALLLDAHSIFRTNYNGKPCQAAMAAVHLGPVKAGQTMGATTGEVKFPRPCVWIQWKQAPEKPLLWRGIYPDAAAALLKIAACSVSMDIGNSHATIGDRRWDNWRFLTAWHWSKWQDDHRCGAGKWTLMRRWESMKAMGYPHGFSAFRKMCSQDLGLLVTKSMPYP